MSLRVLQGGNQPVKIRPAIESSVRTWCGCLWATAKLRARRSRRPWKCRLCNDELAAGTYAFRPITECSGITRNLRVCIGCAEDWREL